MPGKDENVLRSWVFLGGQAASGIALILISAATSMPVLLAGNLLYTWAIIAASVTMRALRQVLVPSDGMRRSVTVIKRSEAGCAGYWSAWLTTTRETGLSTTH